MIILAKGKEASKIQFVATLLGKGIGLAFTVLLARILSPQDYGYLAVAILITGFLTIFSNFGFQTFLIQNDSTDERILHTAFFLESAFATAISAVIFGASFVSEYYYNNATLRDMLQLYSANVLIAAVANAPIAQMKKELNFVTSAQGEVLYSISSNAGRFVFALFGFGALSFPLGDIVGNSLKTVLIYYQSAFRPSIKRIAVEHVGKILRFGGFTSLSSLASYFSHQIDKLLITSFYSLVNVGFYNFGYSQSSLFYNLVLVSQTNVFQSILAKVKHRADQACEIVYKITRFINFVTLPVYVYVILEADLLITVVFTEKWLPAKIYFQVFAFDFMIRTFFSCVTGIQLSFGLAKRAARTKLLTSVLFIALLVAATSFSDLRFYAYAYLLATVISSFINLYVNGNVVDLDFGKYFLNFVPNILVVIIAIVAYDFLRPLLLFYDGYLLLAFSSSTFFLLYLIISRLLNPIPLRQAIVLFKESVLRYRRYIMPRA